MGGNVVAGRSWSSAPLPDCFRFSPRPNQAHKIQWRTWGEVAFHEAIQMDKPIFLILSSSWCQWCHIMDETTLSEPSIITIINNDYIPIRVDSDLRPDVNQRYNQNGWPSVVLLSSEGEILWGGVYVPPKKMLYYLGHIRRYYSEHRRELAEQVQDLQDQRHTQKLAQVLPSTGLRPLLPEERIALADLPLEAGRVLCDLYDVDYGGFSIHPHLKFPHPEALELLLMLAPQGLPQALEMVCYSLEQMRDSGLWDRDAGGFFRYSAASDWGSPHTEKMLDENAALLRVILLTARVTRDRQWYDLAQRLILYINSTLWQPRVGGFAGSQSADEEYYEPRLYSRNIQPAPRVDPTIYTSWNARMASSYMLAAQEMQNPALERMANVVLEKLCQHMVYRNGGMYHYSINGHAELPGQLADQVWMTRALLDAYERSAHKTYLEYAVALMHFACEELLDMQSGLFYDMLEDSCAAGRLAVREQPLVENAIAAECLLRMAVYSKRQNLRDTGLLVLSSCLDKYRRTGIQGVMYACVVERVVENKWL